MTEPGPSTSHSHSKKIRSTSVSNTEPNEAPVIATVQDDDERMLANIGYRQVLTCRRPEDGRLTGDIGASPALHEMDDRLLCHLHSWCFGVCSCNIWYPHHGRWSSNRGVGLAHRIVHGRMHSTFRYSDLPRTRKERWLNVAVAELVSAYPTAGEFQR